jgi:gamma-glutamyltranspeptidase/glutathione hydrolase
LVWDQLPDNIRALYLKEDGERKVVGDVVMRPALADTLEAIATGGSDAFYMDGGIAQSIVDTVSASGGIITLEDLRTYAVRMEEPVQAQFKGK